MLKWTAEQDDYIRKHKDLPLELLAAAVNHPLSSTKDRRRMLCGYKKRPTMVRSDDEEQMRRWRAEME